MTNKFTLLSTVEASSNDTDQILLNKDWNVGRIPNGGYLLAYAAKAMSTHSNHPHPFIVSAYYLEKCVSGEAQVQTQLLREGKSISTLSAGLYQDDKDIEEQGEINECVRLTASFTDFNFVKGNTHSEAPPTIKQFEDCLPVEDVAPMLSIYEQFDLRLDPACTGWNENKFLNSAEMNAWIEYKDGSEFDVFSLLMLPDVRPPAIFCIFGAHGWVPTLEMTVNIRALPKTKRIQVRTKTQHLTQGVMEEDVELWDSSGTLLAVSRQIAKFRVRPT